MSSFSCSIIPVTSQNNRHFSAHFIRKKKLKPTGCRSEECEGIYSVVTYFFTKKFLTKSDWVCWSIFVMDKPHFCSSIIGAIPFDRIHKATNEVHVQKFSNSLNYSNEFQERCESATCNLSA